MDSQCDSSGATHQREHALAPLRVWRAAPPSRASTSSASDDVDAAATRSAARSAEPAPVLLVIPGGATDAGLYALPESRWAGARLLRALRGAGATHLAFESSRQDRIDLVSREGVRGDSAPYAFDPSRAALLRAAVAAGLELVGSGVPALAAIPVPGG